VIATLLVSSALLVVVYPIVFESSGSVSLLLKDQSTQWQTTEVLSEEPDAGTSLRSDLAHPYGSLRSAEDKFPNPYNMRQRAVNPAPPHPYSNGHRPKAVLHREFEHNPYGNHLPWETGPAGALAKDIKRPDR
jgi:hypothetical protein